MDIVSVTVMKCFYCFTPLLEGFNSVFLLFIFYFSLLKMKFSQTAITNDFAPPDSSKFIIKVLALGFGVVQ